MVEMLVALVLTTIVLSGTLALQVAMMQGERDTRHAAGITRLAKAHLETFRTAHYSTITPSTQVVCYGNQFERLASCSGGSLRYYTYLRITGDTLSGYLAEAQVWLRREGAWSWETSIRLTLERAE